MKLPGIKTLSEVFDDPKAARHILAMTRSQLEKTEEGAAYLRTLYSAPKTFDLRMHCLNALDSGLHGVESLTTTKGEFADYLNTGDSYAATVIYWRGRYRVQSMGDFIEVMQRQGVKFQ